MFLSSTSKTDYRFFLNCAGTYLKIIYVGTISTNTIVAAERKVPLFEAMTVYSCPNAIFGVPTICAHYPRLRADTFTEGPGGFHPTPAGSPPASAPTCGLGA